MKNSTSIQRLALLHPDKQAVFQDFINECESQYEDFDSLLIVQGFRSFEEQDAIYAEGRTTPDHNGHCPGQTYTRASGGESWHNYGLAIDIVPVLSGVCQWKYDYSCFEDIAKKYGLTWGAAWHDNDHYEDNCGKGPSGWKWALEKWNAGDKVGNFINLTT